ncbi:MAG: hypothetical protein DCC75_10605 [Proteobacteria bacterium]|nr:MAG: hypothetical protein DCC75_10605 [Pseudomonadota bacterium]
MRMPRKCNVRSGAGTYGRYGKNEPGRRLAPPAVELLLLGRRHLQQCRLQRRMAFYNRRRLYRRKCDHSGKDIVSIFSPDKPFKVYEKDFWYSDGWNALEYGRDFDFTRPFFEQFRDFMTDIPFLSLAIIGKNENSDFTNDNTRLKNCYLVFDCANGQDSMYSETFDSAKDCVDCLSLRQCELCYEGTGLQNCYNVKFSRFCKNCSDSWFLRDCIGCKSCFGCANLFQKEHHIFNQPKSKEEYQSFMRELNSASHATLQTIKQEVEEFFESQPVKAVRGIQNTDSVGDWLNFSKKSFFCFNCSGLEDCRYCSDLIMGAKDCLDMHCWGDGLEKSYNCIIVGEKAQRIFCSCFIGVGCSDIAYSIFCTRNCKYLLGCIGLQKKEYCILNKQYSAQEYNLLRDKIAAHMQETGEWGQFFPPSISPFAYNESLASLHFPLSKQEAQKRGWQWSDYEPPLNVSKSVAAADLPDSIDEADDSILQQAIICEATSRPFRIVSQELNFYKKHRLPLPRRHPDQRHLDRLSRRNTFRVWQTLCSRCKALIVSSYEPDGPETVLCEECFRAAMF